MNIGRLLIADEPPAPQPPSFWLVRLLITVLFAGGAACLEIGEFPVHFAVFHATHSPAPQIHPDKSPSTKAREAPVEAPPSPALPLDDASQAASLSRELPSLVARLPRVVFDKWASMEAPDSRRSGLFVVSLVGLAFVLVCGRRMVDRRRGGSELDTALQATDELRREPRRRTRFRKGKLFDVETRSWVECSIADRSNHGARILLERKLRNFRSYRLFVDEAEETTYEARVAWCRQNEVGLEFRKAYPRPKRSQISA